MKLSAHAKREFRKLLDVVDRMVPFPALDRSQLPIRVFFNTTAASDHLGSTKGTTATLFSRAFASTSMFLYAALHEVGHVVFALLKDQERDDFLSVIEITETRWKDLVLKAANSDDSALKKAAIHEVKLVAETFAEAYTEYWTKTEYLKARSEKLYKYMRKLFWKNRGITYETFSHTQSRRSKYRCIVMQKDA